MLPFLLYIGYTFVKMTFIDKLLLFLKIMIVKTQIKIIIFILALLIANASIFPFSLQTYKENNNVENNITYIVKLNNGDVISGNIIDIVSSISDLNTLLNKNEIDLDSFVPFIIFKFFDEEVIIYEDEIIGIKVRKVVGNTFQYQNHSLFLMPTANPISNNHFAGSYELFLIMGGVGILDYLSIIGCRSFIPFTASSEQISLVNAKVSIPYINVKKNNDLCFAFGYNYGKVGVHNKMHHLYGIGTYNFDSDYSPTNVSAGIFYKVGDQTFPEWTMLLGRTFLFDYPDGAFGICGGFERHFTKRKDLSLILEIWNTDVGNAANTGILLGFRLAGSKVYADFSLGVLTTADIAPFFSFVWMPFSK